MHKSIVLGIDGGGTTTRIMAADPEGNVLAYTEKGCCNPNKDINAKQNVQEGIMEAALANSTCDGVSALVAGLAGLDSEKDLLWADDFTNIQGLTCPRVHVNDAVAAHAGALLNKPGIVAISGTGSIIFGINESGRHIRNYDFHHYAATAARFLAYEIVYQILAGNTVQEDEPLVRDVLGYWNVKDVAELAILGANGFIKDGPERTLKFGLMGPLVTTSAAKGIPVARSVCDMAVKALDDGIRLLGACFSSEQVKVGFIGSVVRDAYIRSRLTNALERVTNKRYEVVEPALSSTAGAVLMALERIGVTVNESVIRNLGAHPKSLIAA